MTGDLILFRIILIGFTFPLIGFTYRQSTCKTTNRNNMTFISLIASLTIGCLDRAANALAWLCMIIHR